MKNFISIILVVAILGGGLFYIHRPETMLMRLGRSIEKGESVTPYMTGNMKKVTNASKSAESAINLLTGSTSDEKLINFVVGQLSEMDWTFDGIERNDAGCLAYVSCQYNGVISFKGDITVQLVEKPSPDIIERIIANQWKISDVTEIKLQLI